jgi:hypothetical protein
MEVGVGGPPDTAWREGGKVMSSDKDQVRKAQATEIARILTDAAGKGAGDFYGGKRSHRRFFASGPFEMDANTAEGPMVFPVTLHDISASGLACWCKHRLAEKTPLRLREFSCDDSGVWLSAKVTHCTLGIRGFLVGAAFEHPAGDDVLMQLAAESEPEPTPPQPAPSWWRRLLSALGVQPRAQLEDHASTVEDQ